MWCGERVYTRLQKFNWRIYWGRNVNLNFNYGSLMNSSKSISYSLINKQINKLSGKKLVFKFTDFCFNFIAFTTVSVSRQYFFLLIYSKCFSQYSLSDVKMLFQYNLNFKYILSRRNQWIVKWGKEEFSLPLFSSSMRNKCV